MQPVDYSQVDIRAFVELRSFQWDTLRRALNDVRADARTRRIAKGIFKTNPNAAIGYAEYYPARLHSERPVIRSYDT